jgi:hypothetical protein
VPDGVLLVAEAYDSPLGYGNQMIGWLLTPTGTTQVFTRRPAFAEWVVPMSEQVLLGGRSWGKGPDDITSNDDDAAWAWMIGSADGGQTWPDASSWTGGDGSCLGNVVRNGDTLVGLACTQDRGQVTEVTPGSAAIWRASIDDFPASAP